jgi:hypothetical protein
MRQIYSHSFLPWPFPFDQDRLRTNGNPRCHRISGSADAQILETNLLSRTPTTLLPLSVQPSPPPIHGFGPALERANLALRYSITAPYWQLTTIQAPASLDSQAINLAESLAKRPPSKNSLRWAQSHTVVSNGRCRTSPSPPSRGRVSSSRSTPIAESCTAECRGQPSNVFPSRSAMYRYIYPSLGPARC